MPQIIPIRDLKNTSEISQMCHASNEPINRLIVAEEQLAEGKVLDADVSLKSIREKYNV